MEDFSVYKSHTQNKIATRTSSHVAYQPLHFQCSSHYVPADIVNHRLLHSSWLLKQFLKWAPHLQVCCRQSIPPWKAWVIFLKWTQFLPKSLAPSPKAALWIFSFNYTKLGFLKFSKWAVHTMSLSFISQQQLHKSRDCVCVGSHKDLSVNNKLCKWMNTEEGDWQLGEK